MRPPSGEPPTAAAVGAGVVVPIRAFTNGMARLAEVLGPVERATLGEELAGRVITAAAAFPTVIVSSAPEVLSWATARDIPCIPDPGGLDDAAAAGVRWCAKRGLARAIVLHADLPRITPAAVAALVASSDVVVLAACRRGDGTPAISVPTRVPFGFSYGPDSFQRHTAEAHAAGLGVLPLAVPELSADVDFPEDLAAEGLQPGGNPGDRVARDAAGHAATRTEELNP